MATTTQGQSWTDRARRGELPATDRTGRIHCAPTVSQVIASDLPTLVLTADGLGISRPSGGMLTVGDLQRRMAAER